MNINTETGVLKYVKIQNRWKKINRELFRKYDRVFFWIGLLGKEKSKSIRIFFSLLLPQYLHIWTLLPYFPED
jgi:hypothetical protein